METENDLMAHDLKIEDQIAEEELMDLPGEDRVDADEVLDQPIEDTLNTEESIDHPEEGSVDTDDVLDQPGEDLERQSDLVEERSDHHEGEILEQMECVGQIESDAPLDLIDDASNSEDRIVKDDFPVTSGVCLWVQPSVWSKGVIAKYWLMTMRDAETLDEDEFLDVVTPGTCLIEMSDMRRFVVKLENGRIQGPARVLQIEDLPDEVFEFVRANLVETEVEDCKEGNISLQDDKPENEIDSNSLESDAAPRDPQAIEDEILAREMIETAAVTYENMRQDLADFSPFSEAEADPCLPEGAEVDDRSEDSMPPAPPSPKSDSGPSISGPHIKAPVTDDSPPAVGIHCVTGMAGATTLREGEDFRVQTPMTLLVETPDGLRFAVKMARGHVFGPARVLEIDDIADADILTHARALRRTALLEIANGCLSASLAGYAITFLATKAPMPEQAPLVWIALSLIASVGILLSIRTFRGVEIDNLPRSFGAILHAVKGVLPGVKPRSGHEVPELPVHR
jgi:hypothetical protein